MTAEEFLEELLNDVNSIQRYTNDRGCMDEDENGTFIFAYEIDFLIERIQDFKEGKHEI